MKLILKFFFLLNVLLSFLSSALSQRTWYVATTGNDATGNGTLATPWRNMQFANDNSSVNNGDTIKVAAGTYTEYVNVTKSLKFYGPNYNISPNPLTTNRNAEAIVNALYVPSVPGGATVFEASTPGINIEIKGFKLINGIPLQDGHSHRLSDNSNDIRILFEKNWIKHGDNLFCGTLTRWKFITISDNFFDSIDVATQRSAIKLNDAKEAGVAPNLVASVTATITDNRIDKTDWAGIILDNILTGNILRNVVRNVPETGIKLAGGIGNATVSQNFIQNANTSATNDVGGIKVYGSEFVGTINITNNTVINSYNGFAVLDSADITGKNIHVNNNSFDNTNIAHAIYHGGTGNLDAACNWNGTADNTAFGSRIFGPVTYTPYITTGTDNEVATPGFQPVPGLCNSPTFTRTVLTTGLNRPWEIMYGPDNMLWITQTNGRVCRVDPNSGVVNTIYTAPDYFGGDPSQGMVFPCDTYTYPISSGTFGLALHPDFINIPYIYYIYSYNFGTANSPVSKYKVRRLTWNSITQSVSNPTDIITDLPLDRSHEGMRMIIAMQSGTPYIYISAGDGTIDNDDCYPPGNNTNLRAQDWSSRFGKILRYNIDGTIPVSNPISGSPVFTRGHRNPLGLAYNPVTDILYESENGKSTDDELNILQSGKNYGWPKARGYHTDNNYPGEAAFVAAYTPSSVPGDALKEAIYSWCTGIVTLPEDPQNIYSTCTVAPSDMIYYSGNGVADFTNSLMVTTLKNFNPSFRACVYVFKLTANGTALDNTNPNPQIYFPVPDPATLRYRDITTTPDGKTFFICTDSWDGVNNQILKFTFNVTYTFIGNGNWTDASNWKNNSIPPSILSTGSEIIIDPPTTSQCILNIPYALSPGAKLTVVSGKNFIVQGNLSVNN